MSRYHPASAGPTPGQLETLRLLSERAGERFVRPRTAQQARGRIRDLEIRLRGDVKRGKAASRAAHQARERTPRAAASPDSFLKLLRQLKKAIREENPKRIAKLEALIDRVVEAPS